MIKPSFSTGYAKNASESANPNLWKGLVGAWMPSFGVTGNTLKDVSGNGNDGTLTATSWVVSGGSKSLSYNGVSSKTEIQPDSIFENQKMSACIWFKPDTVGTNNSHTHLFFKKKTTLPLTTFGLWLSKTRNIFGGFGGGHESTGSQVPLNKWTFAVMSYDGSHRSIFLNGSLDVEAADTFSIQYDSNPIQIGFGDYNLEFDGSVGSASIYNRALSPTEIKQLYLNPSAPFLRKQQTVGISTAQAFNPYWANQATQLAGTLQ